mmetsp:Transcript_74402/g.86363  ORF Transcript_74402/g.86363 Transcript_74402/m.86363 type:complete len:80 (+) Transcript_74402:468-707(+)
MVIAEEEGGYCGKTQNQSQTDNKKQNKKHESKNKKNKQTNRHSQNILCFPLKNETEGTKHTKTPQLTKGLRWKFWSSAG